MKLYDRCMGACCEDIGLQISPEQMKAAYENFLKRDGYYTLISGYNPDEEMNRYFQDIHLIYPMLTYVKTNSVHPESNGKRSKDKIYHYKCKHFDSHKRMCTIYEHRPKMCKTYPDKEFCNNPKCQWKKMVQLRRQSERQENNT